jgi:8-oxo-dGTP pyrophosphatase MutT (NUDIX family)
MNETGIGQKKNMVQALSIAAFPERERETQEVTMLPLLVATDATDSVVYPLDFVTVHNQGVPHRAVHLEILNSQGEIFVCRREDERVEIPGGHVEWIESEDRPESYGEAAMRELCEELNLSFNWNVPAEEVISRMNGRLHPIVKTVNQLPSSQGNNNEWVTVYSVNWLDDWGDPCKFVLSEEGNHEPHWLSVNELKEMALANPPGINSAVRLLLRRRNILIPVEM